MLFGSNVCQGGKTCLFTEQKRQSSVPSYYPITGLCFNLNESFFHLKDKVVAIAIVLQVKES